MVEQHISSNYSQSMGFSVETAGEGYAAVVCDLTDRHMNSRDVCHGGVISGLMDMAAGVAASRRPGKEPAQSVMTVSLTVNYQRPGRRGDRLVAEGRARSGRRIVSCQLVVRTSSGEEIATGVATLAVR